MDDEFETRFSQALRRGVDQVQPPPGLPESGVVKAAAVRRRRRWGGMVAVAAVAAGVGIGTVLVTARPPSSDTEVVPAASTCPAPDAGVLPVWARGGFSAARPRVSHVLGQDGRIVAILFGRMLHAPTSTGVSNKILWVATPSTSSAGGVVPPSDLVIAASLDGAAVTARRVVDGGPGPSIVDLPQPGCWHLDLTWGPTGEFHDTVDLEYVAPQE